MRWHYKEIEKRKGVRYNDCRSVTNPPTKNRKVSLLGTGGTKSALFSECFFAYFIRNFGECGASVRTAWKSGCGAPPKRKRSRGPSAEAEKDMRKHSRRGCSDAGICDKLPHISVCALLRRGKTCGASAAEIPRRFARKLRKEACRMLRRQSFTVKQIRRENAA